LRELYKFTQQHFFEVSACCVSCEGFERKYKKKLYFDKIVANGISGMDGEK
jgi:hypothetical protein